MSHILIIIFNPSKNFEVFPILFLNFFFLDFAVFLRSKTLKAIFPYLFVFLIILKLFYLARSLFIPILLLEDPKYTKVWNSDFFNYSKFYLN